MIVPKSVVLISPDGMLGRAWSELLEREGVRVHPLRHPEFDLTRPEAWPPIDFASADAVINCAAWTDVDGAEMREAEATAVNGIGVGHLAEACAAAQTVLVHYSTDYVFSGQATSPYRVDSPIEPLNAYGRSKALGEERIRTAGGPHLILRTSWLYAPWGNNFVRTMARLARERESLRVVDDQRGRPTSAEHLAAVSWELLQVEARGTLHVTDGGSCTWFEFARHVVASIRAECQVHPCSTEEFPRPAPRPAYSVLDLSATETLVGPMPLWTKNLDRVLTQIEAELSTP